MPTVLEKGPWMFGGKNTVLQQWHPRFQFDKNNISTLPVWVRLHGFPFPLWSKSGLSMTASIVVAMSRPHKLITLASNTTHKIVYSKQGADPTRKFQVRFLCCTLCNWGDLVCDYLNYGSN